MKYALRVLAREKAFTVFAILTLALGIGAVTTIFSVVDGVLLEPLAYGDPGRLYAVSESAPKLAWFPRLPVNAAHFHSWQQECRSCRRLRLTRSVIVDNRTMGMWRSISRSTFRTSAATVRGSAVVRTSMFPASPIDCSRG